MRPVKLILSAFESYARVQEIDFDRFGRQGIYLISGPTGSGKTTIFDAIVFALYGSPSGENRSDKMLRSSYAAKDTPTYVDLTFELHGQLYQIKRNPTYLRPKSRGTGMTTKNADVQLFIDGKAQPLNRREIDQKIIEMVGLNRDQFRQVAMISQGGFLDLLNADSEERTKIFRGLFQTEPYRHFQELLKEKTSEASSQFRQLQNSRQEWISQIEGFSQEPFELDDFALYLKEEKKKLQQQEEELSNLDQQLQLQQKEVGTDENRLQQLQKALQARQKMEELTGVLKHLEQQEQQLLDLKPEITQLQAQNVQLEKQIGQMEEHHRQVQELESWKKELEQISRQRTDHLQVLEQSTRQVKDIEQEIQSAQMLIQTRDLWLQRQRDQQLYTRRCQDLQEAHKEQNLCQVRYEKARQAALDAEETYARSHHLYLDNQAGYLAGELESGKPCPVCGSVHHPAPAAMPAQAVDKVQLDWQEAEKRKAQKTWEKASTQLASINSRIEEQQSALEQMDPADIFPSDVIKDQLMQVQQAEKKKLQQEQQLRKLNSLIETIKTQDQKQESLQQQLLAQTANLEGQLAAHADQWLHQDIHQAKAEYHRTLDRIQSYEKDQQHNQQQLKQTRQVYDQLKGEAGSSTLNQQLALEQVLKEKKEKLNQLKEQIESQRKVYMAGSSRLSQNVRIYRQLTKAARQLEEVKQSYDLYAELDQVLNGRRGSEGKIELETFVQQTYFRRILARANERFYRMSQGQYKLISSQPADRRSKSGLDLAVQDFYNDSIRGVKTLSGGESFLAALSLALGMSDEVQASAGGVSIDTLFIDEGFGSLDENSLTLAIDALMSLAGNQKLIGIISHVEGLSRRIPKQIIVTKDQTKKSSAQLIL